MNPLDPALAALVEAMPLTDLTLLSIDDLRSMQAQMQTAMLGSVAPREIGEVRDDVVPSPHGDLAIRIFRPKVGGPLPTMLYLHGGGWTVGDIDTTDPLARRFAEQLPAVVVSGSYRLGPEQPFPAGFEDASTLLEWTFDHIQELGGDPTAVAIGGESAGGNLAAAAALAARDRGRRLVGQLLLNPVTELDPDRNPTPSWISDSDPALRNKFTKMSIENYLQGGSPDDWRASPARGDLTAVAPALVVIADHDSLRDDGRRYSDRLTAAGVHSELVEYGGLVHGFSNLAHIVPAADAAVADVITRFAAVLGAQSATAREA